MKLFSKKLQPRLIMIVLAALVISTAILSYVYFKYPLNDKWGAIIGGLVTGIIIAVIELLLSWDVYSTTEKVRAYKIRELILHRNEQDSYRDLIEETEKEIRFMATTASRFLGAFADMESKRDHNTGLIRALKRGVKVKILLPKHCYLEEKDKYRTVDYLHEQLAKMYPSYEFRYFDHIPTHYILIFDQECVVGPQFNGLPCRETPGIRLETSSDFAKEYIAYFEREWAKADSFKNRNSFEDKVIQDLIAVNK